MSDRRRNIIGILLLTASAALCVLPALNAAQRSEDRYLSNTQTYILQPVTTEQNGTVRINEADAETLQSLPGIGETYAEMILTEKEQNGPFYYPEDLESVKGIGPGTLRKFRPMIDMTYEESGERDGLQSVIP